VGKAAICCAEEIALCVGFPELNIGWHRVFCQPRGLVSLSDTRGLIACN
jgi:hypothetical protein